MAMPFDWRVDLRIGVADIAAGVVSGFCDETRRMCAGLIAHRGAVTEGGGHLGDVLRCCGLRGEVVRGKFCGQRELAACVRDAGSAGSAI